VKNSQQFHGISINLLIVSCLTLTNVLNPLVEFFGRSVYTKDALQESDALHTDIGGVVVCQDGYL
jgi:hypothetical protein